MILVVRPEPGLQATLAAARAIGLDAVAAPLFEVESRAWQVPDPGAFDALLVGSANVFRQGGWQLERLRHLPVHAVGEATAAAARDAGFALERVGEGGLQTLLDTVTGSGKAGRQFLRLAGVERVPLQAPPGSSITTCEVYALQPLPMQGFAAAALRAGNALVLLHSAAAARHLAAEADRLRLDRACIRLACIGPRVAQAAGTGWREAASASRPDDNALLALARDMCH